MVPVYGCDLPGYRPRELFAEPTNSRHLLLTDDELHSTTGNRLDSSSTEG
jgi:hypothetical protein